MGTTQIKMGYNHFKIGRTSVESKGCSGRPSTSQNEIIINQLGTLPMQYIESQSENLQTRWVSALDPFIPWGRRIWYCFIPEGLLNLVDHFHLRTVKLYTKLDAVILFEIFHYFSKNKYWTGLVCMSLLTNSLLSLTASPGGKKSTRALGLLTYVHQTTSLYLLLLTPKKLTLDNF